MNDNSAPYLLHVKKKEKKSLLSLFPLHPSGQNSLDAGLILSPLQEESFLQIKARKKNIDIWM